MRKIKRPKIGQYVLVTKYSDKSPLDPWRVGFVSEIVIREKSITCKVDTDIREWRNIWSITKEEGAAWLEEHLTKPTPDASPSGSQSDKPLVVRNSAGVVSCAVCGTGLDVE